jgi:hypothetical protein
MKTMGAGSYSSIDRIQLLLAQPSDDRNQQQSNRVDTPGRGTRIAAKTATNGSATCTI